INLASAAPSKIRGRAEFGLYLRSSVASNPSSTNCRRALPTVLTLVSNAAAISRSVQPSPASDASALSRILAFVISCADRLPELISASRRSRSSALNFTTYFFATVLVPATNHPHPRPAGAGTESQKCPQVSRTRATRASAGVLCRARAPRVNQTRRSGGPTGKVGVAYQLNRGRLRQVRRRESRYLLRTNLPGN